GVVTMFAVPPRSTFGADIVTGPDGYLWYTTLGNSIGRVSDLGSVSVLPTPANGASCVPCSSGIAVGGDGNVWFTEPTDNAIARVQVGAAPLTELLWRETQSGDVDMWSLAGGTAVQTSSRLASTVPLDWRVEGVGDLDFNGVPDLVWHNALT